MDEQGSTPGELHSLSAFETFVASTIHLNGSLWTVDDVFWLRTAGHELVLVVACDDKAHFHGASTPQTCLLLSGDAAFWAYENVW